MFETYWPGGAENLGLASLLETTCSCWILLPETRSTLIDWQRARSPLLSTPNRARMLKGSGPAPI